MLGAHNQGTHTNRRRCRGPSLALSRASVLFLGTEKYPEEGEFENFLTQHGGSSNAVSIAVTGCNIGRLLDYCKHPWYS